MYWRWTLFLSFSSISTKNKLNLNYNISHLRIITSNYMENHKNEFVNYDINQHNGITYDDISNKLEILILGR